MQSPWWSDLIIQLKLLSRTEVAMHFSLLTQLDEVVIAAVELLSKEMQR
jgi:hypothetical protein